MTQGYVNAIGLPLSIAQGGTGSTTAASALIALGATGRLLAIQVFNASGTYTANANATHALTFLKGGGGGGAGGTTSGTVPGQGGSEAGLAITYSAVTGSTGYTYTQGAGGGGGAQANNGSDGSSSTLVIGATTITAGGGGGGKAAGYGSLGGTGSNFTYGIAGQAAPTVASTSSSGSGAGGGQGGAAGTAGAGVASNGNTGAGGSGGYGNNSGGAGGSGYLIVYEYS